MKKSNTSHIAKILVQRELCFIGALPSQGPGLSAGEQSIASSSFSISIHEHPQTVGEAQSITKFVTTTAINCTSPPGHPQQLTLLSREADTCGGFPTLLKILILPHYLTIDGNESQTL